MATSFDFSKNKIPAKYKQNQSSKKAGVGELEYDDKRGESVAQLKLQEAANKSSSVRGLEDINNQANNSDNVTQLMSLQNTINEPQIQEEAIHNQESPIQLQSSNNGVVQMNPNKQGPSKDLKKGATAEQEASNDPKKDSTPAAPREIGTAEIKQRQDEKAEKDEAEKKKKEAEKKVKGEKPPVPVSDKEKANLYFDGWTVEFSMDETLVQAYNKAFKLYLKAHKLIQDTPTIEGMYEVIVLMTSINDLGKTKGVVRTREKPGGEKKELSDLAAFNNLFIDPKKYIPEDKIKEHANYFKDGAAKIDRIDLTGGFEFDWGKTFLGERGAQFFMPKNVAEENIEKAQAGGGIPELGIILKLGEYIDGYLDENAFPGEDAKKDATTQKGKGKNPDHKVYMITVPGNVMEDEELQKLFKAHIPWGKQAGSYGFEWVAGGKVPKIDGELLFDDKTLRTEKGYIVGGERLSIEDAAKNTREKTKEAVLEGVPEIVIPPLTKEEFLEQVRVKKIIPFEMDLSASTEKERERQIQVVKNKRSAPQQGSNNKETTN